MALTEQQAERRRFRLPHFVFVANGAVADQRRPQIRSIAITRRSGAQSSGCFVRGQLQVLEPVEIVLASQCV